MFNNNITITNSLDIKRNQPPKCKAVNWLEINDNSHKVFKINNQVKFQS